MDLSPEELILQRAAFLRIEQERKDAEMARTLQQREAEERAEPALSPAEIARILNEVPAQPQIPANFRNIEEINEEIDILNHIIPRPTATRRRPNNAVGARAQGEPDAQRRRIRLDLDTQRRTGDIVTIGASSDEDNDEEESEDSDSSLSSDNDDDNEVREGNVVATSSSDEEEGVPREIENFAEQMANIHERLRVAQRNTLNAPPFFGRPFQRAGIRTLQNTLNTPAVNVPRDGQYGECTLCFEEPALPTGCNKCKQLIGCRACVNTWHSSAYSSAAIPACPLCRHRWNLRPDVREMALIDAEKRRAHLRRRSSSVGNLRIRNAH